MSDYANVADELRAGTRPDLICATCPWDRLCVSPPSTTRAEIDRTMKKANSKDGGPWLGLLTAMTLGGRDTAGELCPVFLLRLRDSDGRRLAEGIRSQMQAWGTE